VKLVPRGDEPDFLLVSCTGNRDVELTEQDKGKLLEYKARGENALRNSGLGYTIIRPGSLTEEPGGQKALVFDQVCDILRPETQTYVLTYCLPSTVALHRCHDGTIGKCEWPKLRAGRLAWYKGDSC